MKLNKYTENQLRDSVKVSKSIAGALKRLGVSPYGGNYDVFKKAIKYFDIDTSHFIGKGWNKGIKVPSQTTGKRLFRK